MYSRADAAADVRRMAGNFNDTIGVRLGYRYNPPTASVSFAAPQCQRCGIDRRRNYPETGRNFAGAQRRLIPGRTAGI